jgi:nitrate reductase delta subunit
MSKEDLQELFTRTFDLNPVCALEVGWHLFGEEYERGAFLVRMRQALRAHGIAEGGELPDHLASMLLLVTKLDADDSDVLVANALVPAVVKMLEPLEKSESPFLPLVKAIRRMLAACAPAGAEVD